MRSGTYKEREKGKKKKERRLKEEKREITGGEEEKKMGRKERPELVDFAHNYNPANEILQFADVAKISRHNDHDRGEARFMNMRIRSSSFWEVRFVQPHVHTSAVMHLSWRDLPSRMRILDRGNDDGIKMKLMTHLSWSLHLGSSKEAFASRMHFYDF